MMVDGTHSDGARVTPTPPMDGYAALYEARARIGAVINERIVAKERGRSRGSSCNRPFPVEGP